MFWTSFSDVTDFGDSRPNSFDQNLKPDYTNDSRISNNFGEGKQKFERMKWIMLGLFLKKKKKFYSIHLQK